MKLLLKYQVLFFIFLTLLLFNLTLNKRKFKEDIIFAPVLVSLIRTTEEVTKTDDSRGSLQINKFNDQILFKKFKIENKQGENEFIYFDLVNLDSLTFYDKIKRIEIKLTKKDIKLEVPKVIAYLNYIIDFTMRRFNFTEFKFRIIEYYNKRVKNIILHSQLYKENNFLKEEAKNYSSINNLMKLFSLRKQTISNFEIIILEKLEIERKRIYLNLNLEDLETIIEKEKESENNISFINFIISTTEIRSRMVNTNKEK